MSADQFPLTRALGVEVQKEVGFENVRSGKTSEVYYVYAADLEKALESAPVVTSYGERNEWYANGAKGMQQDTHTARLVCIQEIAKDTAESLLREYVERVGDGHSPCWHSWEEKHSFIERARRLLRVSDEK